MASAVRELRTRRTLDQARPTATGSPGAHASCPTSPQGRAFVDPDHGLVSLMLIRLPVLPVETPSPRSGMTDAPLIEGVCHLVPGIHCRPSARAKPQVASTEVELKLSALGIFGKGRAVQPGLFVEANCGDA